MHAALSSLQNSLHALLALFYLEDTNVESTEPGDIKYQYLVKVDPLTGKRVGQKVSLDSLIMSDCRAELLKVLKYLIVYLHLRTRNMNAFVSGQLLLFKPVYMSDG